jgi:hypothetical protein
VHYDVFKLLLIVDDGIVDDDGDAINAELSRTGGDQAEVELLRIDVRDDDVVGECLELLRLRLSFDLLALGEFLQQALCNDVHEAPLSELISVGRAFCPA